MIFMTMLTSAAKTVKVHKKLVICTYWSLIWSTFTGLLWSRLQCTVVWWLFWSTITIKQALAYGLFTTLLALVVRIAVRWFW